jgi:hypothetical protein
MYFKAIRNILRPFGICFGYLEMFGIFSPGLVYFNKKIWQPWCARVELCTMGPRLETVGDVGPSRIRFKGPATGS